MKSESSWAGLLMSPHKPGIFKLKCEKCLIFKVKEKCFALREKHCAICEKDFYALGPSENILHVVNVFTVVWEKEKNRWNVTFFCSRQS